MPAVRSRLREMIKYTQEIWMHSFFSSKMGRLFSGGKLFLKLDVLSPSIFSIILLPALKGGDDRAIQKAEAANELIPN